MRLLPDTPLVPRLSSSLSALRSLAAASIHGPAWMALIILALMAGAIWTFVWLADEVREGETHAVDEKLLLLLRSPEDSADPVGPFWLEEAVRDLTALGSFSVLGYITAGAVGVLLIQRKWRTAGLLIASVVGAVLLSVALKLGFERPRPEIVAHISQVTTSSFPSQHSLMSVAVYLTLGVLLAQSHSRRLKTYFVLFAIVTALLVGFSRLYLGVHWPSDVLAGWAVGGAWALLSWFILLRLQQTGAVVGGDLDEARTDRPDRPDAAVAPRKSVRERQG